MTYTERERQPNTTTHDSIPAETGENDGDKTSGDCISRQQAIDFVGSMNMCDEISNEAYKKLTSYLDELPSAQPGRIKGHWIAITSRNNTYKCSVCGRLLVNITDGKNKVAKNYPYCHCGAKMEGGEADE